MVGFRRYFANFVRGNGPMVVVGRAGLFNSNCPGIMVEYKTIELSLPMCGITEKELNDELKEFAANLLKKHDVTIVRARIVPMVQETELNLY